MKKVGLKNKFVLTIIIILDMLVFQHRQHERKYFSYVIIYWR